MIDKIIVLHEYGAPKHFTGIKYLQKEGFIREIQYIEFNLFYQFASGIKNKEKDKITKSIQNIKNIVSLLIKKNQLIVIGIAPLDKTILIMNFLKKRNQIIYFTSWPFWDGKLWAKKPFFNKLKNMWSAFLKDTITVGVTEIACKEIGQFDSVPFHIPHAIDTKKFKPNRIKSDKNIVLFVGNFSHRKGILVLLDAIKETNWSNNTEFWFVGKGKLKSKIIEMQKILPVKHIGYISDERKLIEIYNQADFLVYPSIDYLYNDIENFGISIVEAMSCGLPIITTDCIGPKEIVDDSNNGYIIAQQDKNQLRDKILYLIENSDVKLTMGENSRQKAEKEYDIQVTSKKWKNVLELIEPFE